MNLPVYRRNKQCDIVAQKRAGIIAQRYLSRCRRRRRRREFEISRHPFFDSFMIFSSKILFAAKIKT